MKRGKKILWAVLFPPVWIVVLCVPVAAALLLYTFLGPQTAEWMAITSYVFSAYALTILTAALIRAARRARKTAEQLMDRFPLLRRYASDAAFKVQVSLYLSLGFNVLYAVWKLCYGLLYHSLWFGTLAGYYFLLAVMRFLLLHHANRCGFGTDRAGELRRGRLCGVLLLLITFVLSAEVLQIVQANEGFRYPGYLIYVMALYAFYNIITAATNAVRYRRYHSPAMSAAKNISLAAALVSMLSLETAMLEQFNTQADPEAYRRLMTALTGAGVCGILVVLALSMVVHANRALQTEETL